MLQILPAQWVIPFRRDKTIYEYLDRKQLGHIHDQAKSRQPWFNRLKLSLNLGLLGPSVEISSSEGLTRTPEQKQIKLVEQFLSAERRLLKRRPNEDAMNRAIRRNYKRNEKAQIFVKERMKAARFFLPQNEHLARMNREGMVVWYSPPQKLTRITDGHPYKIRGTELLLVEEYSDDASFSFFVSGKSALTNLFQIYQGSEIIDRSNILPSLMVEGNKDWRSDERCTEQILLDMGSIASEYRDVSALYRCRFMSDENIWSDEDEYFRTWDLIGYPIYVST